MADVELFSLDNIPGSSSGGGSVGRRRRHYNTHTAWRAGGYSGSSIYTVGDVAKSCGALFLADSRYYLIRWMDCDWLSTERLRLSFLVAVVVVVRLYNLLHISTTFGCCQVARGEEEGEEELVARFSLNKIPTALTHTKTRCTLKSTKGVSCLIFFDPLHVQ
jgi:hypothetical protein